LGIRVGLRRIASFCSQFFSDRRKDREKKSVASRARVEWGNTGSLDGTENFIALTIDRETSPPTLYACTDNSVFVSRDEADTWLLAKKDLPSRVHCTSFAIGAARPSGRHLYLSTYGRSVWQANI